MKTKVIFRRWHCGDIIALFPRLPADEAGQHCMSYEHIGQHGAATPDTVIMLTTAAKPQEYQELADELERIGYKLSIQKRVTKRDYLARTQAAATTNQEGNDGNEPG